MKYNKKIILTIIVVLTILLIFIFVFYKNNNSNQNEEQNIDNTIIWEFDLWNEEEKWDCSFWETNLKIWETATGYLSQVSLNCDDQSAIRTCSEKWLDEENKDYKYDYCAIMSVEKVETCPAKNDLSAWEWIIMEIKETPYDSFALGEKVEEIENGKIIYNTLFYCFWWWYYITEDWDHIKKKIECNNWFELVWETCIN